MTKKRMRFVAVVGALSAGTVAAVAAVAAIAPIKPYAVGIADGYEDDPLDLVR